MENKNPMGRLMLITDSELFPDKESFLEGSKKALTGGVDTIQLREKTLSARELLCLAHELRKLTHKFRAKLIINERSDIAKLAEADGVHLPAAAFSAHDARALLGEKALIGVSAHSLGDALSAEAGGADYVTLSPIYHTPSKAAYGEPIGLGPLAETTAELKIPVYALGGINKKRVKEVLHAGAAGVALISAILCTGSPRESARELADELIYYNNEKSKKAL
ncbi:MAG: thiamine phosphate synthase [Thermodesulfobacteriota bacterium]